WLALTDFLAFAILVARTRNLALVSAGQILDVHVGPIDPAGNVLFSDGDVRVVRQDFRLVGILQWLSGFRAALNVLVVAVASLTPNIELRQNAHKHLADSQGLDLTCFEGLPGQSFATL